MAACDDDASSQPTPARKRPTSGTGIHLPTVLGATPRTPIARRYNFIRSSTQCNGIGYRNGGRLASVMGLFNLKGEGRRANSKPGQCEAVIYGRPFESRGRME